MWPMLFYELSKKYSDADFQKVTNGAAVMYSLFLIVFLLMYIAFWKKDSPRKHSP